MFGLKIALTLILMGSIPMWIRLVQGSSIVIGMARLTLGLGLTVALLRPSLKLRGWRPPEGQTSPNSTGVLVSIGLLFGAHWYTYFESIQRSSATLGILALATYGIHVTWLGAVFSNRRPKIHDWFAVFCAALGAFLCLPSPETDGQAFVGFLLGMCSGLLYACLPLLHQKIAHVPLATRGAHQFLFAWILFLPLSPLQDWNLDRQSWIALGILGVFCTFIAHNLWISITTQVRPSTAGLLYYMAIPVTMILETAVFDQAPKVEQLGGAGLILLGNLTAFLKNKEKLGDH